MRKSVADAPSWSKGDNELRDGYCCLKDALPIFNQKSSKVSLLDHATTYTEYLEMTQQQLQMRLQQAENVITRLHQYIHFSSTIDCSTHTIHVGSSHQISFRF
jgi:hypothetical protein